MKGGFNNPPNAVGLVECDRGTIASMKGGFNNPPNTALQPELRLSCRELQ